MTEILLQQLEEKMMARLSEMEILRRELDNLRHELDSARHENASLKVEREKMEDRIKGIIALIESVNVSEAHANVTHLGLVETALAQEA